MIHAILVLTPLLCVPSIGTGDDWTGWRGPGGRGVGAGSPPTEWSEDENIRWRVDLPGKGLASPIIVGERVIVTTAVGTGETVERETVKREDSGSGRGGRRGRTPQPLEEQDFLVLCFDRAGGELQWETSVLTAMPHEGTHPDGSYASATPVSDGERIYVSFGSYGVHALDMEGEVLWSVDLGDLNIQNEFGEGSSPVLVGDLLIQNWDHEGDSFLVALDRKSGAERWRTERPRGTSWATPIIVQVGDGEQIVVGGAQTIAYDPASGKELWSFGQEGAGGGGLMCSPIAVDELVLCSSGGRRGGEMRALVALAAEDSGDSTEALWARKADVPGIPSLLYYEGHLYFLKGNSGMLSVMDPTSGDILYGPERLQGVADVYASPVAAGGHLYVAGRDGTIEVLSTLPEIETLAVNTLDDLFDASPAIAGDELYLRGREHLYCIAGG